MKKINIGLIYTGGTIGMEVGATGLGASGNFTEKFYQCLPHYKNNSLVAFSVNEFEAPIDSAHANLDLAVKIQKSIQEMTNHCDAFLVLMGSDTLTYIAATLAYLQHQKNLPIVVTGAMRPLSGPSSDAINNLNVAINYLIKKMAGVNIVFGGKILSAVRASKLFTYTDEAIVNTCAPNTLPTQTQTLAALSLESLDAINFTAFDIRVIRVMPSMHHDCAEQLLSGQPAAIIIQCYGSGTTPAASSSFAVAVTQASNRGIPIFAISQTLGTVIDFGAYAASAWLTPLHIVRCGDMNLEATYTKLWYLLNIGCRGEKLAQAMVANLCGEITSSCL